MSTYFTHPFLDTSLPAQRETQRGNGPASPPQISWDREQGTFRWG